MLTTYMLRVDAEPSQVLARFIERVAAIESTGGGVAVASDDPDSAEDYKS